MDLRNNHDINQDPDYILPDNLNSTHQELLEKNARAETEDKLKAIIDNEFSKEINSKKSEINNINKNLNKSLKILHYLRYASVTDFYNRSQNLAEDNDETRQSRIHPAVKQVIQQNNNPNLKTDSFQVYHDNHVKQNDKNDDNCGKELVQNELPKKIPRYVAPKDNLPNSSLARATDKKVRERLIVGNVSYWIDPKIREGNATHKWTLYVRSPIKNYDISQFISKIRFFLHPSYKPNDVVEVTTSPFILSRLGWGEFPARIQLHFKNNKNKPTDVIHNIKLDRTFTGLQTIGSETVIDVWINQDVNKLKAKVQLSELDDESIKIYDQKQNILNKFSFLRDHDYFVVNQCNTTDNSAQIIKKVDRSQEKQIFINEDSNSSEELDFKNNSHDNYSTNENSSNNLINDEDLISKNELQKNLDILDPTRFVQQIKPKNILSVIKYLMSRTPLITNKAKDETYKINHPYATTSTKEFESHSIGKQKSLERYRAKTVQSLLKKIFKSDDTIWSVKELILYARYFHYTPSKEFQDTLVRIPLNVVENNEDKHVTRNSSTVSDDVYKWLTDCSKVLTSNSISINKDEDDYIDVIDVVDEKNEKSKTLSLEKKDTSSLIVLDIPQEQKHLQLYVHETAQDIGIKLNAEEIIPGVVHNTANLLIMKSLEYLVDDLLRISHSRAFKRAQDTRKLIITPNDIHAALLSKEEFDIFTNVGLGRQS